MIDNIANIKYRANSYNRDDVTFPGLFRNVYVVPIHICAAWSKTHFNFTPTLFTVLAIYVLNNETDFEGFNILTRDLFPAITSTLALLASKLAYPSLI